MSSIYRIELWHVTLLLILLASLMPFSLLEPRAFILGGAFMAVNFLLLALGVRWVLTPLADKGKVWMGVALLLLKFIMLLGLLSLLFFRFEFHVLSFALGFSTLLLAIVCEGFYFYVRRTL
jgi:hypothetical protein